MSAPKLAAKSWRLRVDGQVDRFLNLRFLKNFITDALPGSVDQFGLADFDQVLFSYTGLPQAAPGPGEPIIPPFGAYGHLTALSCIDGCVAVELPAAVPEPATIALLFAGMGAIGVITRRRLTGVTGRVSPAACRA